MAAPRDVGPFLQKLRAFLLGRQHIKALRFADGIAARTQPPPELPGGPAHKQSANYYYTRDARREVVPPTLLALGGKKSIAAGESAEKGVSTAIKPAVPGTVWKWD